MIYNLGLTPADKHPKHGLINTVLGKAIGEDLPVPSLLGIPANECNVKPVFFSDFTQS